MRSAALGSPVSSVWKKPLSVEHLAAVHVNTAAAHVGLEFLEVGLLEGLDEGIGLAVVGDHDRLFVLLGPGEVLGKPVLDLGDARKPHGGSS